MCRHPYRVPAVYFIVNFAAVFLYWSWGRLDEKYNPPLPLATDFIGFYDPSIGMNLIAALVASFVIALIPAIGALAGFALAPTVDSPSLSRAARNALVSLLPSAAYCIVLSLLRGYVYSAHDVGTEGAVFEFALIVLAGVWTVSPVILSRRLFRKHATGPTGKSHSYV